MKIAILGATGCIGRSLLNRLKSTDHEIVAFYRRKKGVESENIRWVNFDLQRDEGLDIHIKDVDVLYYFIHSMDERGFVEQEKIIAEKTNWAAKKCDCKIVYLGGIINQDKELSDHLLSRKLTGEILAGNDVDVTELRASIVLAKCSDSYIMSSSLAKKLPVMVVPKWLNSKCSPIYVEDLVDALIAAGNLDNKGHQIINIGGERITYKELLKKMGEAQNGRSNIIYSTPFVALKPSFIWIWLLTGVDIDIAKHLTDSLVHDTSTNVNGLEDLIGRKPTNLEESLKKLT